MIKKTILIFMLLQSLVVSNQVAAAPVVTDSSGTICNQSLITTGSGFGNKSQAVPQVFDDFEAGYHMVIQF